MTPGSECFRRGVKDAGLEGCQLSQGKAGHRKHVLTRWKSRKWVGYGMIRIDLAVAWFAVPTAPKQSQSIQSIIVRG